MTKDELKATFEPWRMKNRRQAWRPKRSAKGTLTWFGGNPTGTARDPWPTCSTCSAPMRFLFQLDFESVPSRALNKQTSSLLQLFYCSTDDGTCETWRPQSGTHYFRILAPVGTVQSGPVEPLPQVVVGGWENFDDFPACVEHEALGIKYDYDFSAGLVTVRCADPALSLPGLSLDMDVAETIATAATGDKLLGWPNWVQGVEYPLCPICNERMELVMQVDSNQNLDYMFGDVGTGHVTRCPEHPEEFAFGWACG